MSKSLSYLRTVPKLEAVSWSFSILHSFHSSFTALWSFRLFHQITSSLQFIPQFPLNFHYCYEFQVFRLDCFSLFISKLPSGVSQKMVEQEAPRNGPATKTTIKILTRNCQNQLFQASGFQSNNCSVQENAWWIKRLIKCKEFCHFT